MSRVFILLNGAMTLMFLLSVVVQYNDPDPVQWMAIYGAAATLCIIVFRRPVRWQMPATVAFVALVWGVVLVIGFVGRDIPQGTFTHFSMENPASEEPREAGGLAFVAVWMTVLSFRARKRVDPHPFKQNDGSDPLSSPPRADNLQS